MLAEKYVLHTDREGRLSGLPVFSPNEEVEVIVLRREKLASQLPEQQELEQAYRDAVSEIDAAWEVTAGDGLDDEAW